MGLFLFIIGIIGWHVGMYGMFKKAGIEPWKAFIPFYNTWLIVEKCKIPKYWFWLQLIPIAGQFITIWITIIFVMHFKKVTVPDHAATVFFPFLYFPYLGFSPAVKWHGGDILKHYHKPASREWIDAGVFAIVAATEPVPVAVTSPVSAVMPEPATPRVVQDVPLQNCKLPVL